MSVLALAEIGLQSFIDVYRQILEEHPEQSDPFKADQLRTIIWARMMANESGMEKKSFKIPIDNLKRTKLQFPYLPEDIRYTGCCAIKKNGELYTPCCGKTKDSAYCHSCSEDKEGNAKDLPYGSVEDREQNIAAGKFQPITYATWLKKAKKNMSQVYDALNECGISLVIPPAEHETREVPKKRNGRPAKSDDSAGSRRSKASEEDGYSSTSSVSSKEPEDEPVKAVKAKSKKSKEPEPEDEPVKPKKSKAKEPDAEPVKPKKAKKSKEPEPEPEDEDAEPVKPVKAKKEKAEKAEKPKKPKAEKAEKAEKPKKEKGEKKEKKEKAKPAKAESDSDSDDDEPIGRITSRLGSLVPNGELEAEEQEQETRIVNGKAYTNSNGNIYTTDGTYVGSVNEDGDWVDEDGDVMEADGDE